MQCGNGKQRMVELAAAINHAVAEMQELLSSNGLTGPSFDEESPYVYPRETLDAQDRILDATAELFDLLLEPSSFLMQRAAPTNGVSIHAINRFKIAYAVPLGGESSYGDISAAVGLPESTIRRLLRNAMSFRIFRETERGTVAHTKMSKYLTLEHVHDWMSVVTKVMWPSTEKFIDAIERWPHSEEPNETGFDIAFNRADTLYDYLKENTETAARFANSMTVFTSVPGYETHHILDNYDWEALGNVTAIDVGGGRGGMAVELARRFKNLTIMVQDTAQVIEGAEAELPRDVKDRVTFASHDLFQPQSQQANLFYLKWVLHNWSDKYCIRILRALIPSLESGTRILILDSCLPKPGSSTLWRERNLRAADVLMGALFNAKERSKEDWKTLLARADARFYVNSILEPKYAALSLIDVRWRV